MSDIVFLPAHQIAQMIRDRAVSATEVIESFLTQIVKYNPKINTICNLDEENARKLTYCSKSRRFTNWSTISW
jgi:amidase